MSVQEALQFTRTESVKKRSLVYYERRFGLRRKIQILNQSPLNLKMNNINKDLLIKTVYLQGLDFTVDFFYFFSL